jgi:hypothetical protein
MFLCPCARRAGAAIFAAFAANIQPVGSESVDALTCKYRRIIGWACRDSV